MTRGSLVLYLSQILHLAITKDAPKAHIQVMVEPFYTIEVSSIAVSDCLLEKCTTGRSRTRFLGGFGGALYAGKMRTKSTLLIQISAFVWNIANQDRGDVYAGANSFILRDCHMARSRGDKGSGRSLKHQRVSQSYDIKLYIRRKHGKGGRRSCCNKCSSNEG